MSAELNKKLTKFAADGGPRLASPEQRKKLVAEQGERTHEEAVAEAKRLKAESEAFFQKHGYRIEDGVPKLRD